MDPAIRRFYGVQPGKKFSAAERKNVLWYFERSYRSQKRCSTGGWYIDLSCSWVCFPTDNNAVN